MIKLEDLTPHPERFFELLPSDWREAIEPYWPEYARFATIYGLVEEDQVIAGGIVFSTVSPDIRAYDQTAQKWLDRGYQYIGFLFVKEDRRKEGLGSIWVKEIKAQPPGQKYWLSIDDYGLTKFYKGLGFEVVEEVENEGVREWIMVD